MAAGKIEFWFEFGSTYSHIATHRIEPLARAAGVSIAWKAFLLGPIFSAQGWNDSPFNIYPAKGRYMWRDMERLADKYAIRFRRPSVFPRNGLLAARVACAFQDESWLSEFVPAVYRANFADDQEISSPNVIEEILSALGLKGNELIAKASDPSAKERLRAQTGQASALGIFGAPSFIAGGELFWGNDRLEDAIEYSVRA